MFLWAIIFLSFVIQSIKFLLYGGKIKEKSIPVMEEFVFGATVVYFILLFSFFIEFIVNFLKNY
jgi:hypothetical protein